MIKSLRLIALAATAVSLSACYNPDGSVNPGATALAGAAVGAGAALAVGAASQPVYYRPYYGYGYRPYYRYY